eukprot:Phypoly_transcript_07436.p1 GENE.Phypoly_transcript_07436~~Phypoly_transcript_07436.p1  ORF type:complete len:234 (-),score=24.44 Phypoly_transcript_07436:564-1265(-)
MLNKNNKNQTPHPYKTTNVIYCIYSNEKHAKKLYVGLTKNSALSRLLQHINAHDNTPIHKYIQKHGPEKFKVFVLEQIPKNQSLEKAERNWILKLQTQINLKNPTNLNYIRKNYISRKQKLPQPIITKKQNKNNKKQAKINTNSKNKRMFRTRQYDYRIMVLQSKIQKGQNPNLNKYSNKSIRMLISVLINKKLLPHKPRQLGKPNIFLHHKTKPTVKITYFHNHIKEQITIY